MGSLSPPATPATHWRSQDRWDIGESSLLLGALGLRPFFDVTWTARHIPEPDNNYGGDTTWYNSTELEVAGEAVLYLQSLPRPRAAHAPCLLPHPAASVLSTGPVGIGDRVTYTNASLVAAACMRNGTLLKPSRPLAAVDATFGSRGFAVNGGASVQQAPALLQCTSGGGADACAAPFVTLLIADASAPAVLWPSDLTPDLSAAARLPGVAGAYAALPWSPGFAAMRVGCVNCSGSSGACTPASCGLRAFADASPLNVTTGGADRMPPGETGQPRHPFELLSLSPILAGGWSLLGEVAKFTRVSPQRFLRVSLLGGSSSGGGLNVTVAGAPDEVVEVTFLVPPAAAASAAAVGSEAPPEAQAPSGDASPFTFAAGSSLQTVSWAFGPTGGLIEVACSAAAGSSSVPGCVAAVATPV